MKSCIPCYLLILNCKNSDRFLTFHVFLPNDVVKQLGVVGVHPPTAWTCHHLLLRVASQVLSQFRTPFDSGFTICRVTERGLSNPTLTTDHKHFEHHLHLRVVWSLFTTVNTIVTGTFKGFYDAIIIPYNNTQYFVMLHPNGSLLVASVMHFHLCTAL